MDRTLLVDGILEGRTLVDQVLRTADNPSVPILRLLPTIQLETLEPLIPTTELTWHPTPARRLAYIYRACRPIPRLLGTVELSLSLLTRKAQRCLHPATPMACRLIPRPREVVELSLRPQVGKGRRRRHADSKRRCPAKAERTTFRLLI